MRIQGSLGVFWKSQESQKYNENSGSSMEISRILGVQNPPFPPLIFSVDRIPLLFETDTCHTNSCRKSSSHQSCTLSDK